MSFFDVENLDSLATIWTIRAALACMFGTFLLRLWELPRSKTKVVLESKSDSPLLDGAKHIWLLGSFFSLLHAMAAMIFYHHGSHALAAADTARQTQALLGISVGAGIYFNYAFVLIWLVDAHVVDRPKRHLFIASQIIQLVDLRFSDIHRNQRDNLVRNWSGPLDFSRCSDLVELFDLEKPNS